MSKRLPIWTGIMRSFPWFVITLILLCNGFAEGKGKPKQKCRFEPLDVYERSNRLEYKRYSSQNHTYASLLKEWWKLIDSIDWDNGGRAIDKEQLGPFRYLVYDGENDDEIWYVPEGKFIFLNSGRIRIWGSEYNFDEMESNPADLGDTGLNDFNPDEDTIVPYLTGLNETFLGEPEAAVLFASLRGALDIPLFNKKRLDCFIDGCEVQRCEDYLVATDIFRFQDRLYWDEDLPNDHIRSHGYVLLLPNDLEPGMHTVETRGHTKNFLYPVPEPAEAEWSYGFNICIGDPSNCAKTGKRNKGKGKRRGLVNAAGRFLRKLEKGWNTQIAYADWV